MAYDLRGHGQSERAVDGDYALSASARTSRPCSRHAFPTGSSPCIAGHSLGAMSIAAWAEHHDVSRRAGATALINTGVGNLINEQLLFPVPRIAQGLNKAIAVRGFLGARTPLPRVSTPVSYAAARYIAFGPAATPAQIAFYERMLVTCRPDVRASIGIAMSEMDLHHALAHLTVPTLVIAGENDRLTPPSHARRIAEMLPALDQLIVLEETGHMGPLERPRDHQRGAGASRRSALRGPLTRSLREALLRASPRLVTQLRVGGIQVQVLRGFAMSLSRTQTSPRPCRLTGASRRSRTASRRR